MFTDVMWSHMDMDMYGICISLLCHLAVVASNLGDKYSYQHHRVDWYTARNSCTNLGMALAEPNTAVKQSDLIEYARTIGIHNLVFIAGFQENGNWNWASGKQWDYSLIPRDRRGGTNRVLSIDFSRNIGQWIPEENDRERPFICEQVYDQNSTPDVTEYHSATTDTLTVTTRRRATWNHAETTSSTMTGEHAPSDRVTSPGHTQPLDIITSRNDSNSRAQADGYRGKDNYILWSLVALVIVFVLLIIFIITSVCLYIRMQHYRNRSTQENRRSSCGSSGTEPLQDRLYSNVVQEDQNNQVDIDAGTAEGVYRYAVPNVTPPPDITSNLNEEYAVVNKPRSSESSNHTNNHLDVIMQDNELYGGADSIL